MVQSAFGTAMNPAQANDAMKAAKAFVDGDLISWSGTTTALPDALYDGGVRYNYGISADVGAIKRYLDGGGLCLLEVRFGGDHSKMHFVVAIGYNGNDIIFNDPWYGDQSSFAGKRYGTGNSADDIWAIHFYKDKTLQGGSSMEEKVNEGDIDNLYEWLMFRKPDAAGMWGLGGTHKKLTYGIADSSEFKDGHTAIRQVMQLTGAASPKELPNKVKSILQDRDKVTGTANARGGWMKEIAAQYGRNEPRNQKEFEELLVVIKMSAAPQKGDIGTLINELQNVVNKYKE